VPQNLVRFYRDLPRNKRILNPPTETQTSIRMLFLNAPVFYGLNLESPRSVVTSVLTLLSQLGDSNELAELSGCIVLLQDGVPAS